MTFRIGQNSAKAVLRNPAFIEQFTLTKQAPGDRDSTGVYIPGAETITDESGNIQPLNGKQRQELLEGERSMDAICILFETGNYDAISPLRIGTAQTDSDIVTPLATGINYAVRVVHDMSSYGHLEIFATRLEDQNG